jgi:hypothetical protein
MWAVKEADHPRYALRGLTRGQWGQGLARTKRGRGLWGKFPLVLSCRWRR